MHVSIVRENTSRTPAYIFMIFGSLLLALALLTNLPIDVRNILILVGATGFFSGGFLVALGSNRPVEAELAGEIAAGGALATGSLVHALGGRGNATFLPPDNEHDRVMQWTPAPAAEGMGLMGSGDIFVHRNGTRGIRITPLAGSLIARLKGEYGLVLPAESGLMTGAIREICEDVLPVARRVDAHTDGDRFVVMLHGYQFSSGCASVHESSPELCLLCPCSTCSLIACMIAEGLGREVVLDRIVLNSAGRSLRVELSCIPGNGGMAAV
jgi:hypothetical protein